MRLFISCSSYDNIPNKYYDDCRVFLGELFKLDNDLAFGACDNGLMGLAYKIALENGRDILGVYPEIYKDYADKVQGKKISVRTVGERTDELISDSDVLIFLPGGYGTVYELFTSIESKRGNEHNKPIIIYNSDGYFDKLLEFISLMCNDNFASLEVRNSYLVCDNVDEVINYLNNYYNKDSEE